MQEANSTTLIKSYFMRLFLTLMMFAFGYHALPAQSGILKPVKWKSSVRHVESNVFELIFDAKIDDGWATYSQSSSEEDGPIPTFGQFR